MEHKNIHYRQVNVLKLLDSLWGLDLKLGDRVFHRLGNFGKIAS
jgi:hypothetical protein